jgi:REP element-mobilizing transposase RayT
VTAPRQVLPGTTYLITRRCAQRQLLLRPTPLVNQLFGYLLAVAARRFGVQLHAVCVLSNHFHLVVTDTEAKLPAFGQYLDGLLARSVNAAHGRWESFWAPNSYSAVTLVTPADIVDKTAYVLANPVQAGLVRRACRWPGLWSAPEEVGLRGRTIERPEHFFRARGRMPANSTLEFTTPPGFESPAAFREALALALARREEAVARSGRAGVEDADRVGASRTRHVAKSRAPRRGLSPRVACRDAWMRIEALRRLMDFQWAYREARRALLSGAAGVVFPAGTYLLRVVHRVACAVPDATRIDSLVAR